MVVQNSARDTDAIQVSFDVTVDEGGTNSTGGTPFVYQASLTAIVSAISDNIGLVEGTILFRDMTQE